MDLDPTQAARLLARSMRAVFVIGSVLVAAAGIQLFFLTERTDHWFAWTIKLPLTAAFLGAFYWTALALAWQSARKRVWIEARVGVPGVFAFITLTFVLTLLHLGSFHFHSEDSVAKGAAYLWFVIYLVDPILVAVAWWLQVGRPGVDPPRRFRLPGWYRAVLVVQAVLFVGVGAVLFAAPERTAGLWPWTLTSLTARAVGAWVIGLGLVVAQASWENAWERIRIATVAYVVLGTLQLVALARYGDQVEWGRPVAWVYVVLLASMLLLGVYGWVAGFRAERAERGVPARPVMAGAG